MTTFARAATEICSRHAPEPTVRRALEQLGAKAEAPLDGLDTDRKRQLVSQFVRALRNVGVREAHQIEHELVRAVGASPNGRKPVVIKDAISLIAVRNHIHQLATAAGLSWSAGMQVQSAVSEVARFVAANGGGRIETETTLDGRIHFEVRTHRDLGALGLGTPTMPAWLIGVSKLAQGFRAAPDAGGTRIEFSIATSGSMVA